MAQANKYEDFHRETNGNLEKKCSICKEWFPCTNEYFYKNKSSKKDGLNTYCKTCTIEKSTKYVKENLKKINAYTLKAYHENRWGKKDIVRRSNIRREKEGKVKAWRQSEHGREIVNRHTRWRQNNKAHIITKQEWESCKEYFNNSCAYCGMSEIEAKDKYNNVLHKEHVIDCGRNDLKNCIPACKGCNSEKHDTSLNDWYNSNNPKYDNDRYLKICQWIRHDCKKYIQNKNKMQ